jgi:hypothetical protein
VGGGLTPADTPAQQIARTGHPKKNDKLHTAPDYFTGPGL